MKQRWSKWFWDDWENEPALKLCSFAAQGVWMRLLCIAARHDPIGYVANAGKSFTIPELVRIIGGTKVEIESALRELEANGVFSKDNLGRIYSRRMVSDAKRAKISRENGKKGGNPDLITPSEQTENPSWDNYASRARMRAARDRARSASASDSDSKKGKGGVGEKGNRAVKAALTTALSPGAADNVIEHRRGLKYPLTVRAAELLAKNYAQAPQMCGLSPDAAADYQIAHGWRGFDPEWVRAKPNGQATGPPIDEVEELRRKLLREEAEKDGRRPSTA